MDGCLSQHHQFAHEDVLWAAHRHVAQLGLSELNAHPVVLQLLTL